MEEDMSVELREMGSIAESLRNKAVECFDLADGLERLYRNALEKEGLPPPKAVFPCFVSMGEARMRVRGYQSSNMQFKTENERLRRRVCFLEKKVAAALDLLEDDYVQLAVIIEMVKDELRREETPSEDVNTKKEQQL